MRGPRGPRGLRPGAAKMAAEGADRCGASKMASGAWRSMAGPRGGRGGPRDASALVAAAVPGGGRARRRLRRSTRGLQLCGVVVAAVGARLCPIAPVAQEQYCCDRTISRPTEERPGGERRPPRADGRTLPSRALPPERLTGVRSDGGLQKQAHAPPYRSFSPALPLPPPPSPAAPHCCDQCQQWAQLPPPPLIAQRCNRRLFFSFFCTPPDCVFHLFASQASTWPPGVHVLFAPPTPPWVHAHLTRQKEVYVNPAGRGPCIKAAKNTCSLPLYLSERRRVFVTKMGS